MPSRFVAPKRVETLEDVRKALQLVQEQFDANGISRARQQLVTKDTTLAAGEFVRASPRQGATLYLKLPKATADNIGRRIEISIERPNGTVRIAAQKPDTVSGLATASFTLAGLIILESNGTDQWVLFNQLPTNSPAAATNYFFSNANNVSFGTAGSTVTASVTVASTQASIVVGTLLSSRFSFINSNNVSWTINATGGINASASFPAATAFVFSNSNGLTWGSAGSTVTGSFSTLSFSNAGNVSFGLAGSTLTATASDVRLGFVSHSGGNVVSNVTGLVFADASNVTWSLSTAAGGATVRASVGAGGGGGIGLSHIGGNSVGGATQLAFSNVAPQSGGITWSLSTAAAGATLLANINPYIQRVVAGGSSFSQGSVLSFDNSGGAVSFGLSVVGSVNIITASHNGLTAGPLAIGAPIIAGAAPVNAGTINITNFNFTNDARGYRKVLANISNTSSLFLEWDAPQMAGGGWWNDVQGNGNIAFRDLHRRPYFFQPFPQGRQEIWGRGNGEHRMGDWFLLASGSSNGGTSNSSLFATAMLGLYVQEGNIGSRLSLINSVSAAFTQGTDATSFQSNYRGNRWIRFQQSAWSNSSSVLTAGEYWCAIMVLQGQSNASSVTNGTGDLRMFIRGNTNGRNPLGNFGLFGAPQAAAAQDGPFWGFWQSNSTNSTATTTALPVTVVSSQFRVTDALFIPQNAFIPGLSIRGAALSASFPLP